MSAPVSSSAATPRRTHIAALLTLPLYIRAAAVDEPYLRRNEDLRRALRECEAIAVFAALALAAVDARRWIPAEGFSRVSRIAAHLWQAACRFPMTDDSYYQI